jgi:hypothetical protein
MQALSVENAKIPMPLIFPVIQLEWLRKDTWYVTNMLSVGGGITNKQTQLETKLSALSASQVTGCETK